MEYEELREFVVAAHRNGYATTSPDADGEFAGKVIEYEDGNWRYVDRYYGSRSFVGIEVVVRDGTPVWGMHYHGSPTGDGVDHERVYAVLRDSLANASSTYPYRGPETFVDDPYRYRSETDGELSRFSGTEWIERDGAVVYRGRYGGGSIT